MFNILAEMNSGFIRNNVLLNMKVGRIKVKLYQLVEAKTFSKI